MTFFIDFCIFSLKNENATGSCGKHFSPLFKEKKGKNR